MFNYLNGLEDKTVEIYDDNYNAFKGVITKIYSQGEYTIFVELDNKKLINARYIKRIEIVQ